MRGNRLDHLPVMIKFLFEKLPGICQRIEKPYIQSLRVTKDTEVFESADVTSK